MMKKTGILGGTFDPIHNGHIHLAQAAYEKCGLDEVLFMPTYDPYYKKDSLFTAFEDRLEMTRLACLNDDKLISSDFERENKTDSYTVNTLRILKAQNPDSELYFIVGGDSLFSIEKWYKIADIFNMCTVIVSKRKNENQGASGTLKVHNESMLEETANKVYNLDNELDIKIEQLKDKYNAKIINLYSDCVNVSSSDIRKMASEGESVKGFVPDAVFEYIKEKNLYYRGDKNGIKSF